MDFVYCYCSLCDGRIGSIPNHWIQIGQNYLTPALDNDNDFQITTSQKLRYGEKGTLLEGCELQNAQCVVCASAIGIQLLHTPMSHVLGPGRLVFRKSSLILKSGPDSQQTVKPEIKRVLKLRDEAESPQDSASSPSPKRTVSGVQSGGYSAIMNDMNLVQLKVDVEAQREDIERISHTGVNVVSSVQTSITQLEKQVKRLTESIQTISQDWKRQQRELGSVKSELAQYKTSSRPASPKTSCNASCTTGDFALLKRELGRVRDENVRLRTENEDTRLLAQQGISMAKDCASEVASLRKQLSIETNRGPPLEKPVAKTDSLFSSLLSPRPKSAELDEKMPGTTSIISSPDLGPQKPPQQFTTDPVPRKESHPGQKRRFMDLIDDDDDDEMDLIGLPQHLDNTSHQKNNDSVPDTSNDPWASSEDETALGEAFQNSLPLGPSGNKKKKRGLLSLGR